MEQQQQQMEQRQSNFEVVVKDQKKPKHQIVSMMRSYAEEQHKVGRWNWGRVNDRHPELNLSSSQPKIRQEKFLDFMYLRNEEWMSFTVIEVFSGYGNIQQGWPRIRDFQDKLEPDERNLRYVDLLLKMAETALERDWIIKRNDYYDEYRILRDLLCRNGVPIEHKIFTDFPMLRAEATDVAGPSEPVITEIAEGEQHEEDHESEHEEAPSQVEYRSVAMDRPRRAVKRPDFLPAGEVRHGKRKH